MGTEQLAQAHLRLTALLSDSFRAERRVLLATGIRGGRVLALYPLKISNLHPALNRHLDAGGSVRLLDEADAGWMMALDQRLFEGLDVEQRNRCHRDLQPLMMSSASTALFDRVERSPSTRFGVRALREKKMQVMMDLPKLYTACWHVLNPTPTNAEEAARFLTELVDRLLPGLELGA